MVKNHLLDKLVPFYNKYPYFNSKFDSNETRLKWIHSQPDNGDLFFKMYMRELNIKFLETKTNKIQSIENFISKLRPDIVKLESKLEEELEKIKRDKNEMCMNLRLVKIYTNIEELELDNNREITIDEDKLLEGEVDDKVKINQYAILLKSPFEKLIYERMRLQNGKEIWNLASKVTLDTLIDSYKGFCNQQGATIDEIDIDFFKGRNKCKYSEFYKKCVPVRILKLKEKIDSNTKILQENLENLEKLAQSDAYLEKFESSIVRLQHILNLESDKERSRSLELEKIKSAFTKTDDDELYGDLYYKIDRYLETISTYDTKQYYLSLDVLIDKYGRKASDVEDDGENKRNVYCRLGKKVIACRHKIPLIDYHKNLKTLEEATDIINAEYGVEDSGIIWCKNCGEEITLSDYESLGDFTKTGARDNTHEEIDLTEEYQSKENSEIAELIRKTLLEGNDKSIESGDTLSTFKIIQVLLSIMGIKLTTDDEIRLIKSSEIISKPNIKLKDDWIRQAQKAKKKLSKIVLENAYNSYKVRNTILFSASNLFLYLQSGIPDYNITKTFSKCKPSIKGYPLDKIHKYEGIEYISCILDSLTNSGEDWQTLKKIKIKDNIMKIVDQLLKDDYILYRFGQKRKYLEKQSEEHIELDESLNYIWNEFRPPLNTFNIDLSSYKKFNIDKLLEEMDKSKKNTKIINAMLEDFLMIEQNVTLKLIEEINNEISTSKIENPMFDPTPIDNSCCLGSINENYDYYKYFIEKNEFIKELISLLNDYNEKKTVINNKLKTIKVYIKSDIRDKIASYNLEIGYNIDDITNNDIVDFFIENITEGPFVGNKHLYTNNICDYTGEHKLEISAKKYTIQDFQDAVIKINQTKLFSGNYKKEILIDDLLKIVLETNTELFNNEYLYTFHSNLIKSTNSERLWEDLTEQIIVEADGICKQLETKLSIKDTRNIKELLLKLGEFSNILETNKTLMSTEKALEEFYLQKEITIKSYIYYFKNTIAKIKNVYLVEEEFKAPLEWKIDQDIEDNYNKLLNKDDLYKKFIPISEKYHYVFDKIFKKIEDLTTNISILKGQHLVYNCYNTVINPTEFTHKNVSALLHYIFLYTLSRILELDIRETQLEDVDDLFGSNPECSDVEDEYDDLDITRELQKTKNIECKLVLELFMKIEKDYDYIDKHTRTYIDSVIEQKAESDKESNLKFIQELDKETWNSLKTMISLGIDKWKNLSNKNKDLYIPPKVVEGDLGLGDLGEESMYTEEDINQSHRAQAQRELGNDFTDEQFQEWSENRAHNEAEDRLAYEERDIMEDDDETLE